MAEAFFAACAAQLMWVIEKVPKLAAVAEAEKQLAGKGWLPVSLRTYGQGALPEASALPVDRYDHAGPDLPSGLLLWCCGVGDL
ncbi:hypothetical protein CO666_09300 [Rhizobium chutanense]|uniref:Uncharacterized protein n=1 Tax=Rhizobium chutanense TaxID=2035448 RepID=A0A2A6JEW8_9HYPH|nr:hypothetical protein [Rhizobium chutanense]PDT04906.1 hypothetical protein CO666_09300 [Rhizobium chutanense]